MELRLEEFDRYLQGTKRIQGNSRAAYQSDVREFSVFLESIGMVSPKQLTRESIQEYLQALKNEGKTTATINRRLSSIRCYAGFLVGRGDLDENPAVGVRSPKTEQKPINCLTIAEVETLLGKPDRTPLGMRDLALLEILYGAGIRAGEAAAINLEDVNLRVGFITCGEAGKARAVPLGRPARAALEAYVYEARPLLAPKEKNEHALFVNYNGERLTRQGIWKVLKSYGEGEPFAEKLTPQILRNSFAVHMLQNGADFKSVQELLGIEDLSAIRTYLGTAKTHVKEVYDRTHPRA